MNDNLKTPAVQRLERLADPEWKQEYEMPDWYQERLKQFVELLESRDELKRALPTLPPEAYMEAAPVFRELDQAVEILEDRLAVEYDNHQEEERRAQEVYELTWLQDSMSEELYIWVKHKKPYIFEEFEEYATSGMTDAERAAHQAIVARREAAELAAILASPTPPVVEFKNLYIKHLLPDEWMPEQLLHIILYAYETDDFFRDNLETWKRGIDTRRNYGFDMGNALPVRRRNMEDAAVDLRKELVAGGYFLLDYAEECRKNGKFVLSENPPVKEIDELFERLEENRARKCVVLNHTMPERLEEYIRCVTEDLTPAETAEFLKEVDESDEKKRRPLINSLEKERQAIEIVEARRAAGEEKIDGPQLRDAKKRKIESKQYVKIPVPEPGGKIAYDLVKRYEQNLKAFYAVTGDHYTAVRFEDEQSRSEEEIEAQLDSMRRNMEQLFIIIKHENPEKFPEFEKIVTEEMTPDQRADFYARIAALEAEMREAGN